MIVLQVRPGQDAAVTLVQVKLAATRFPGRHRLRLLVQVAGQTRQVTLGKHWRYDPSEACLSALREFGDVTTC